MRIRHTAPRLAMLILLLAVISVATAATQGRRFYDDDPIARELDTEDASKTEPWDVGLFYDLTVNLFVTAGRTPSNTRAQNVNTIDEVPDSSWYTNRAVGALPLEQLQRGPNVGAPPAPEKWAIIREKASGYAPGFTARDAKGETWFVSFDPPSNPKGATAAVVIANRMFWALGYNQVETFLTRIDPARLEIDPKATVRRPSGARTPFTKDDLDAVFEIAMRAGAQLQLKRGLALNHACGSRPDQRSGWRRSRPGRTGCAEGRRYGRACRAVPCRP